MTMAHRLWDQWLPVVLSVEWRCGLIALGVALAVAMLARLLGHRRVAALACGVGLAAGWAWLARLPAWPRSIPERLPEMAIIATLPAWLGGMRLLQRARPFALVAVAALCGWWLAGAPHDLPQLREAALPTGVLAGWIGLFMLALADADSWRAAAAAAALWAALAAIGSAPLWTVIALAPAAAALGALAAPPSAGITIPAVAGIGAAVGGSMLGTGLLRRGHVGAVDLVALAPLAVVWLGPKLLPRLRSLGAAAPAAAALLAGATIVLLAFAAAALAGIR